MSFLPMLGTVILGSALAFIMLAYGLYYVVGIRVRSVLTSLP